MEFHELIAIRRCSTLTSEQRGSAMRRPRSGTKVMNYVP